MIEDPNELIDVCDACLTASCWHGEYMCQSAQNAGIVKRSRASLNKMALEHPSNYSDEKLLKMGIKTK